MDILCLLALDLYLQAIIAPCVVVLPQAEVQEGGRRVGGFAGAFVARGAFCSVHTSAWRSLAPGLLYIGHQQAIDQRSRVLRFDEVQRQRRAGCHSRKGEGGESKSLPTLPPALKSPV